MPHLRAALAFVLLGSLIGSSLAGCSGARPAEPPLTLEGTVTTRGNAPFTALVLETDARTLYRLCLPPDCTGTLGADTPARVRLTGQVYRADWDGRPFAHLRVTGAEIVEP